MRRNQQIFSLLALFWWIFPSFLLIWNVLRQGPQAWQTGDWLINYAGGFVRRGLAGELLFQIHSWVSIPSHLLLTLAQLAIYAGVVFSAYRLITKSNIETYGRIAIFSPLFLGFYITDPQAAFKKELLALALVSILSQVTLESKKVRRIIFPSLFIILYIFAFLSHEVNALVGPSILFGMYYLYKEHSDSKFFFQAILPIWISTSFLGLISLYMSQPDKAQIGAICARAESITNSESACFGAIEFLALNSIHTSRLVAEVYSFGEPRLVTFFMALAFSLFIAAGLSKRSRVFLIAFLLSLVSLVPAFIYAIDWGRWLMLSFSIALFFHLRFGLVLDLGPGKTEKLPRKLRYCLPFLVGTAWSLGSIPSTNAVGGWWAFGIEIIEAIFTRFLT